MHIAFVRQDLPDNQDFFPFRLPSEIKYTPVAAKLILRVAARHHEPLSRSWLDCFSPLPSGKW
jgi:hypothetical protein